MSLDNSFARLPRCSSSRFASWSHLYGDRFQVSVTGAERAEAIAKASGKPLSFFTLPADTLQDQLGQAGLPAGIVTTIVSIQQNLANGDFDIVTG